MGYLPSIVAETKEPVIIEEKKYKTNGLNAKSITYGSNTNNSARIK